jgi:hypothetical protein
VGKGELGLPSPGKGRGGKGNERVLSNESAGLNPAFPLSGTFDVRDPRNPNKTNKNTKARTAASQFGPGGRILPNLSRAQMFSKFW